jgi:hypothetical protein
MSVIAIPVTAIAIGAGLRAALADVPIQQDAAL